MATETGSEIMEAFSAMQEHESDGKCERIEEAVIFLGCTGDGKSTLTQFLSGNNRLRSEGQNGQFTINDCSDKIGAAGTTIRSQTIFPNLIPHGNSGRVLLDCPGFRDTRSSSTEVTCTILTKRALKSCSKVKLILVVSEYAVMEGGSRSAFLELVKHSFEFVKNFEKFKNSVALFVTKVTNVAITDKAGNLCTVSDRDIVNNIRKFLEETRKTIEGTKDVSSEKCGDYANAVFLIDLLLRGNRDIPRICILRRPSALGSLEDSLDLQNCKCFMNNMIENILDFTQISEDDFGFSISAEAKLQIFKAVEDIIERVPLITASIMERIERIYHQIEGEDDMEHVSQVFKEQYEKWNDTSEKLRSSKLARDFLNCLLDHMQFCLDSSPLQLTNEDKDEEKDIIKLQDYIELLELMQKASNEEFPTTSSHDIMSTFDRTFNAVRNANIWYGTMKKVPKYLQAYDCQSRRNSDDLAKFMSKLEKWINDQEGTLVEAEHFKEEFAKICSKDVVYQINFAVSPFKLKHLCRLCKLAFAKNSIEIVGNRMRIAGRYVLLSEIVPKVQDEINELDIFASEKLFIDCDFSAVGRKMQMFVAVPEWEVTGEQRSIVLDGVPGETDLGVSKKGESLGMKGKDGMPGFPGGSGGNFLGVLINLKNAENLKISACGGKGGYGQDGGEGHRGEDGTDAKLPANQEELFNKKYSSGDKCKTKNERGYSFFQKIHGRSAEFKIPGEKGKPGGNGGNGGCGGEGGFPGQVLFIGSDSCNLPKVVAKRGDRGQNGKGGRGGLGGKTGISIVGSIATSGMSGIFHWKDSESFRSEKVTSEEVAEKGLDGKSGCAKTKSITPEPCEYKNFIQPLADYIGWFSSNFETESKDTEYIKRLREISNFGKCERIQAFADELIQLENLMVAHEDRTACRDKYVLLKLYILYFSSITYKFNAEDFKILCFVYVITLFRHASDLREIPESKSHFVSEVAQKIVAGARKEENNGGLTYGADYVSIFENIMLKLHQYEALEFEIDRLAGVSLTAYNKNLVREEVQSFKDMIEGKLERN
ncbi:uncharacterized protein LOC119650371 [Hermetia illucens]|nr:uncharacterized protein LOC119650371 [Hermetia illucens]